MDSYVTTVAFFIAYRSKINIFYSKIFSRTSLLIIMNVWINMYLVKWLVKKPSSGF